VNKNSRHETLAYADPIVRNLNEDDFFQFERRGNYRVDKIRLLPNNDRVAEVIFIPDGS